MENICYIITGVNLNFFRQIYIFNYSQRKKFGIGLEMIAEIRQDNFQ